MTRHEQIMELMANDPDTVADMLVAWETEVGKTMPSDFKNWWQNSPSEWPLVTRLVIESLREREKEVMQHRKADLHDSHESSARLRETIDRMEGEIEEAKSILRNELDRAHDPRDTLRILVIVAVNALHYARQNAIGDSQSPPPCSGSFRAGDTVHHGPSGEDWTLANDEENGRVSPSGWPATMADAHHCRLLEPASEIDRIHALQAWAKEGRGYEHERDHRTRTARRQLSAAAGNGPTDGASE